MCLLTVLLDKETLLQSIYCAVISDNRQPHKYCFISKHMVREQQLICTLFEIGEGVPLRFRDKLGGNMQDGNNL